MRSIVFYKEKYQSETIKNMKSEKGGEHRSRCYVNTSYIERVKRVVN